MNIGGASRLGHGVNKLTLGGMSMPPASSSSSSSSPVCGSGAASSSGRGNYTVVDLMVKAGPLGMTVEELVPYEKYGELVGVAVITKINKGGQAHGLGAKKGDRIVGVGGRDAISMGNFKAKIQFREGGVGVKLVRKGKKKARMEI